jgi:hypothetical protein
LKYSSGGTDLDRLAQELAAERNGAGSSYATTESASVDDDDDEYADYDDTEDEDAG